MPSTRKRKSSNSVHPTPDSGTQDVPPTRSLPSRTTRGHGGHSSQLAKVGEMITHKPRKQKETAVIPPAMEPPITNPMAPEPPKSRKKKKVGISSFSLY